MSVKVLKGLSKVLLVVCLVAAGFIGNNRVVSAADDETPDYRIQVSPARLVLDLKPGDTVEKNFKVQNTGSKEFDFELSTAPFSVNSEDEEYKQDFATVTDYNDIKDWITFSEDKGTIPAGGTVDITATIAVPKDIPSGGQYAAIFAHLVEPESNSQSSGVGIEKRVGLLVYSKNIDGNTREEGEILENKVPSFKFTPPITATSVVKNTGNVHAAAQYILQIYPFFGGEEVYTNEENPETHYILPETSRFNQISWDGSPQLGIFKVKQTVKFLGEESVTEKVVFICPLWFLFIVLAIIFLAVFWIVGRVLGRRKETD